MSQPVVIKIGGALLARPDALTPFWRDVRTLSGQAPVLIVHGGGPQATDMARRLGHQPRIVHGRRVTTDLDLSIIHWTLRGSLNTHLVAEAVRNGLSAVGLSGVDAGILRVSRRPPWTVDGETVDFGWVGEVEEVRTDLLRRLMDAGSVPVLAPLGYDTEGQTYNVNADTVSCALASALGARRFILVTESGGLRRDADDPSTRLSECDRPTSLAGLRDGWIHGGMRVKLEVAFKALSDGIPEVFILPPDDLLGRDRGTRIVHSTDDVPHSLDHVSG